MAGCLLCVNLGPGCALSVAEETEAGVWGELEEGVMVDPKRGGLPVHLHPKAAPGDPVTGDGLLWCPALSPSVGPAGRGLPHNGMPASALQTPA